MAKANTAKGSAASSNTGFASKDVTKTVNDEPIWPRNKGIGMHITGEMIREQAVMNKDFLRQIKAK